MAAESFSCVFIQQMSAVGGGGSGYRQLRYVTVTGQLTFLLAISEQFNEGSEEIIGRCQRRRLFPLNSSAPSPPPPPARRVTKNVNRYQAPIRYVTIANVEKNYR